MRHVLIDANVMMSTWALDVLMQLADAKMIVPSWSERILSEYLRASERHGREEFSLRVVRALERSYPSALVEGWEGHLEGIDLPDPDDRHVVAAALEAECDTIATFNLRDFPQDVLGNLGLRAISPDDLVMEVVHEHPVRALIAVDELIGAKRHPLRTYDEEIAGLRRCGMRRFADWLDS